jgi:hypothetical protein
MELGKDNLEGSILVEYTFILTVYWNLWMSICITHKLYWEINSFKALCMMGIVTHFLQKTKLVWRI